MHQATQNKRTILRLLSDQYHIPIRTLRRTLTINDLEEELAQYIVNQGLEYAKLAALLNERPTGDLPYIKVAQHYFDAWKKESEDQENANADAQLAEMGL